MKRKMMLIINPFAGKARAKAQLYNLVEKFYCNGYLPTVFPTDAEFGAREIAEKHAGDFDIVVCCGGDGTLNQVVSGLSKIDKRPPIGYIPAGTANDVATSLELSGDMMTAAENILNARPMPFDIGHFNSKVFVYIASFGAFTEVSYSTPQQQKNSLGQLAYILQGIKSVQGIKSYHLKVESGGRSFEDDYVFGAMTNSLSFAGLLKLNREDVCFNDGLFEVMLIRSPKNALELQATAASLLRRQYDERYITFFHASDLTVKCEEPIPWTTDGEFGDYYNCARLKVEHKAVSLMLREDCSIPAIKEET